MDKKQENVEMLVQEELEFRKAFEKQVHGNQDIKVGTVSIRSPSEADVNAGNNKLKDDEKMRGETRPQVQENGSNLKE